MRLQSEPFRGRQRKGLSFRFGEMYIIVHQLRVELGGGLKYFFIFTPILGRFPI